MKRSFSLRGLATALALVSLAGGAYASTYQLRVPVQGLKSSVAAAPSAVGNGTSVAGACASGAMTGCAKFTAGGAYAVATNGTTVTHNNDTGTPGGIKVGVSESSGKWYWEATLTGTAGIGGNATYSVGAFGIVLSTFSLSTGSSCAGCSSSYFSGSTSPYATAYSNTYLGRTTGSGWTVAYPSTHQLVRNDVLGFLLDLDNHTLEIRANNTAIIKVTNIPASTAWSPVVSTGGFGAGDVEAFNFGQTSFTYAPPTGFNAGFW